MTTLYKYLDKDEWKDLSITETEGRFTATIGDTRLSLELIREAPPVYTFLLDGREVLEIELHPEDKGAISAVNLGHYPYRFHIVPPSQAAVEAEAGGAQAGGKVVAPMPGKVVEIKVKVGDTVEAGQGVIVVEAMKMQNELMAEGHGIVDEIKVKTGQTVEGNQVLIVIRA